MILTLSSNNNPVYLKANTILCMIEIDEPISEGSEEIIHMTRIFTTDLNFGEDVPSWIDVKETIEEIMKLLSIKTKVIDFCKNILKKK